MVQIRKVQNTFYIGFNGTNRFNCFVVEKLSRHVTDFLSTPHCDIRISLEDITFIDSCGMDFLLNLARLADAHGFTFRLCHISDEVKELFQRTDLAKRIPENGMVLTDRPCRS